MIADGDGSLETHVCALIVAFDPLLQRQLGGTHVGTRLLHREPDLVLVEAELA